MNYLISGLSECKFHISCNCSILVICFRDNKSLYCPIVAGKHFMFN